VLGRKSLPTCHRHGVGFGQLGVQRLFDPLVELQQRIGVRGIFTELCAFVAFAQVGKGGGGVRHAGDCASF